MDLKAEYYTIDQFRAAFPEYMHINEDDEEVCSLMIWHGNLDHLDFVPSDGFVVVTDGPDKIKYILPA